MEDKINIPHPKYAEMEVKRDVFRAVYGGTDSIRATTTTNLPKYPGESPEEYKARLDASTIDGIVLGGVETLTGTVFDGEINVSEVDDALLPLLENVDNQGNHFNIFARDAFKASFEGFAVILVDAPNAKANDAGEAKAMGLRPYMNLYRAGDVINWRYRTNPASKQKELAMIVLREVSSEPNGRWGVTDVTRYRAFYCENKIVTWELWREQKDAQGKATEVILEEKGTVEKVEAIPVSFIGDVCDDPKLLVESRLEIKAYQKESSFDVIEYLSVPTFYTKGYEGEETLTLGASSHVKLPLEGEVGYAQIDAAGHDSLKGSIDHIKQYIRARVNYLVESANVDKTATESVLNEKSKQSRLIVWHDEFKDALESALLFMSQMAGIKGDKSSISLNTSWANAKLTLSSDDMAVESNLVMEGTASLESFVERRAAAGLLPDGVDAKTELARIKAEAKELRPVQDAGAMPNETKATDEGKKGTAIDTET